AVGIGARRWLPDSCFQFLYQTSCLACGDDELHATVFVSTYRIPTVESRIGPRKDRLHLSRQRCEHTLQVSCDLRTGRPISVVQLSADVFSRLRQKREDRLIALLTFVLRVVSLATSHLLTKQRVHGRVRV